MSDGREHERMVIFRLRRLKGIADPGIVFLVPFIDKPVVINLTQTMPGGQGLSKRELDAKILGQILSR
jgi:regulator of protease activity HflC (stomatin/prohibitin superfamily)